MINSKDIKRDKVSVEKFIADNVEKNFFGKRREPFCEWCSKKTENPCETVKDYFDCKNNKEKNK